jgi:organic hydroperoxide reductase OsmC/OhrA
MDESTKALKASSIPDPSVLVRGSGKSYAQAIVAGPHPLCADEPFASGGTGTGPSPYDLLLAALGACTSMTVGMYARGRTGRSKEWSCVSGIQRFTPTTALAVRRKQGFLIALTVSSNSQVP